MSFSVAILITIIQYTIRRKLQRFSSVTVRFKTNVVVRKYDIALSRFYYSLQRVRHNILFFFFFSTHCNTQIFTMTLQFIWVLIHFIRAAHIVRYVRYKTAHFSARTFLLWSQPRFQTEILRRFYFGRMCAFERYGKRIKFQFSKFSRNTSSQRTY